jgi:hypothetical protein
MKRLLSILIAALILHSPFSILNCAHAFRLPDTGQTKCYDPSGNTNNEIPCAGTGQDGAYNFNPMSYTDNGNGTVTDNNTGLVWQKCSVGQNNDATCSGTAAMYNWYQATGTYDASYNPSTQNVCGSLPLAGGGWRVPSKKELTSIVDYSIPSPEPTIQQSRFPSTVADSYWSSTTYASSLSSAWVVNFVYSSDVYFNKYNGYCFYVRCVR